MSKKSVTILNGWKPWKETIIYMLYDRGESYSALSTASLLVA